MWKKNKENPIVSTDEQTGKEDFNENQNLPVSTEVFEGKTPSDLSVISGEDRSAVITFSQPKYEQKFQEEKVDFSGFYALASLLNKPLEEVVEDCYLFGLKNLMNKIGKVIVRYNLSGEEIGKVLHNTSQFNAKEVLFSPAFLPACKKEINKNPQINQDVGALIDFPFGESSLKSKLLSVKECISFGVDSVTVMTPNLLMDKAKIKELKKLIKKLGKFKSVSRGVAISAMDVNTSEIKTLMKFVEKFKINHVTFIFGNVTAEELTNKILEIKKFKGKKELRILANVDTIEAVNELTKLDVDVILTPFADEIGKELVKKFKIKRIKLM